MSALGVRARNLLTNVAELDDPAPEDVATWIRRHVPTGHNQLIRMQSFLRRIPNCGEGTAHEILAYAFGEEFLKLRRVRLACSACGETASLSASGVTCDKFTRWWVTEHAHEESGP